MLDVEFYRLYNGLLAHDLMPYLCRDFCDFHKSLPCFFKPFLPWFSTVLVNNVMKGALKTREWKCGSGKRGTRTHVGETRCTCSTTCSKQDKKLSYRRETARQLRNAHVYLGWLTDRALHRTSQNRRGCTISDIQTLWFKKCWPKTHFVMK